jgi:hypothetical protein
MRRKQASLLDYWNAATVPEMEAGLNWYARARGECLEIAARARRQAGAGWRENAPESPESTGMGRLVPDSTVLAMAAILSPRKRWSFALRGLEAMLTAWYTGIDPLTVTVPGFRSCQTKANKALHGDMSGLSGPKVCAFYDNLLQPETSESVTVDCWAYRAYIDKLKAPARWLTPRQYDEIAKGYMWASGEIGAIPCQFQAVVWLVARRASKFGARLFAIKT